MKTFLRMNLQLFAEEATETGNDNPDTSTVEEVTGAKEQTSDKKYSDDEVNEIINSKFAKWQKDQEVKQQEANKLAEMNAEEKTAYEKEQLEARLAEYEKKEQRAEMGKEATRMLAENSITASEEILNFVVTDTAEETSNRVKTFSNLINVQREEISKEFERRLGSRIPLGGSSTTSAEDNFGKTLAERSQVSTPKHNYFKQQ